MYKQRIYQQAINRRRQQRQRLSQLYMPRKLSIWSLLCGQTVEFLNKELINFVFCLKNFLQSNFFSFNWKWLEFGIFLGREKYQNIFYLRCTFLCDSTTRDNNNKRSSRHREELFLNWEKVKIYSINWLRDSANEYVFNKTNA